MVIGSKHCVLPVALFFPSLGHAWTAASNSRRLGIPLPVTWASLDSNKEIPVTWATSVFSLLQWATFWFFPVDGSNEIWRDSTWVSRLLRRLPFGNHILVGNSRSENSHKIYFSLLEQPLFFPFSSGQLSIFSLVIGGDEIWQTLPRSEDLKGVEQGGMIFYLKLSYMFARISHDIFKAKRNLISPYIYINCSYYNLNTPYNTWTWLDQSHP